jgi:hypothetical protein
LNTADPNNQNAVCITRFVEDSSQMVYLYQGIANMFFLRPLEFIRLSGASSRNIAMFRDFSSSYFHNYIHPDWPGIEAAIANQRRIFDSCPQASELYCVGTSMGAFSAILFGHYLKADIVYAFAAQSRISDTLLADISGDVPPAHRDLALLLSEWNGRTRYRMYYCKDFAMDREAAEGIAHCPGVELVPLPGNDHNVFLFTDPGDLLPGLFPEPSVKMKGEGA